MHIQNTNFDAYVLYVYYTEVLILSNISCLLMSLQFPLATFNYTHHSVHSFHSNQNNIRIDSTKTYVKHESEQLSHGITVNSSNWYVGFTIWMCHLPTDNDLLFGSYKWYTETETLIGRAYQFTIFITFIKRKKKSMATLDVWYKRIFSS